MLLRRLKPMTVNAKFSTNSSPLKGVTFKYQSSLPSLPVPSIESTKLRYLKSIIPLVRSQEEYESHEALVNDFFQGQGAVLHERLLELQSKSRNWLSNYWDEYAYLTYNDPIIPYVSYFYGHKDLPHHLQTINKNQIFKSIAVINSVLDFVDLIKSETLPPEVIKGTPYCMQSFQRMFNNSRFPLKLGQDSNIFHSIHENDFIIVIVQNNFFKLFTHKNGERLPISVIHKQLLEIINLANSTKKGEAVGLLTTLPRDQYFKAYQELNKSPTNVASLDQIFRSTFILTLDEDQPITYEDRAHFAWHGNGENRFFDKPIQFFIAKNGYVGFIAEHSKMDGTPTLLLNEFVNRELNKLDQEKYLKSLTVNFNDKLAPTPEKLPFEISPNVKQSIVDAKLNFESEFANHDVKVWHYNKYGKNQIKKFKTSPDAFIQMIIQLGYYKLTSNVVPTYEAASTRKFFGGRTEATRSVSEESLKFVSTWDSPSITDSERYSNFHEAVKSHINYIKNASNGEGVDRHFLGLKFQLRPEETPHELFSDKLFNYSSTWLISTSQLSSNFHDAYGWSEVNPIGWGLAYQLNDDFLHINICTRRSSGNKSEELWYYLSKAADEIFEVLTNFENSKASKL
ncbi:hypothetical protein WICMUC_003880 [Wickerhamomyces mucosus]|uniref:Carnitine O-acetyltransferase, mitochondrial n=1 Tax=Wickerhamomyces mucosus TaxID=1378264 RepID=A0A9P8PKU3_9ASCO|nr:hypothetical protein WICMUC_003880 [Wickerhamomyces mucosus]